MKVFAVLIVFCFHDFKFLIVTPSLDNDTSCYLCQIKELLLSSLEVRIVGIVVKMQTHFATIAMSIFPEPKVHATFLYSFFIISYPFYLFQDTTAECGSFARHMPQNKYASGTLCLQSIIISRISSTILELCSKNIMFAEHNNFKL